MVGAALVGSWTGWTKWAAAGLCFAIVNLILHGAIYKGAAGLVGATAPAERLQ